MWLQRASDADAQLLDEQAKVMRLEVTVAEQQQQLGRMEELEKELQHYRYFLIFRMCLCGLDLPQTGQLCRSSQHRLGPCCGWRTV